MQECINPNNFICDYFASPIKRTPFSPLSICMHDVLLLIHFSLDPLKGFLANSADPDQMQQNVVSDLAVHSLQMVYLFCSRKF